MFSLDGKVAVVTGAASGLGKATALRFARAGAKTVPADIADAKAAAEEAGGIYGKTDVSQEGRIDAEGIITGGGGSWLRQAAEKS